MKHLIYIVKLDLIKYIKMKNALFKSGIGMRFKINNSESIAQTTPQSPFDYQLFKSYMNINDFDSFLTSLHVYLPQVQYEYKLTLI